MFIVKETILDKEKQEAQAHDKLKYRSHQTPPH